MPASELFSALLESAKQGNVQALDELVRLYEPEVRMVARMRLSSALRQHLDSVDLVQSVHKSILLGISNNRFDISSPEKLIALALTMVRHKTAKHWRKHQRQKNVRESDPKALTDFFMDLESNQPSAEQVSERREVVEQVLRDIDSIEREIIAHRIRGHSTAETARLLELDPDVLRVKLSRLRKKLRGRGIENGAV